MRFGGELDVVGHRGDRALAGVVSPAPRQIQRPVDQRVAFGACVGQIDCYLRIFDPSRGSGVLELDAERCRFPFSHRRSHRPPAPHRRHRDDRPHRTADPHAPPRRPTSPDQQVLQPVRAGVGRCARSASSNSCAPDPKSDPASTPPRSATAHSERTATRSDRHLIEARTPPINVYAMSRGDRGVLCCLQTPKNAAVTAATSANTPTTTIYGCSTRQLG
jgi:hypothetical protein